MTSLSRRTTFPPGWAGEPLERRIALSRALLAVERILPRLWPAFGFGGFYIALALTGLFEIIPWPAQALLLAATITAIGLSLEDGFRDFQWPHTIDGARRLERDNRLVHRPISERGDVLAGAGTDAFAQALWKLHQARALPGRLRLALPHTDLAARDPRGLRWYLLVALAVGAAMARSDTGARLIGAFDSYKRTLAHRTWVSPEGKTHRPTVNLGGVFHCGEGAKINTVPVHASFTIDRRVLPRENHAAAERELRAFLARAAAKIPQCRITVRKISENFACFSEPRHPLFAPVARCVAQARKAPTTFSVSTGFNDMHFFSHHLKIPTIGYGPGGEDYHAVDERAKIKELLACARAYADLLTSFAG